MKSVGKNTTARVKEKYSMSTWGEKIPEQPGISSERIHPALSFQLGTVLKRWHVRRHRLIAVSPVYSCKCAVVFSIFYVVMEPAFSRQHGQIAQTTCLEIPSMTSWLGAKISSDQTGILLKLT